jgi:hypothetical protein
MFATPIMPGSKEENKSDSLGFEGITLRIVQM